MWFSDMYHLNMSVSIIKPSYAECKLFAIYEVIINKISDLKNLWDLLILKI